MTQIKDIFKKVQLSTASHQKQLKILRLHYDEVPLDTFFNNIRIILNKIFTVNTVPHKNPYVERTLEFLAQFVADVTPDATIEDDLSDACTHPFLTMIIKETLKYHNLPSECLRYHSCLFVRLIFQQIGCNKNLDNNVCDLVEEAMLERTSDPKPSVRLQAVLALIRLQDPMNAESPISRAYLSLIVDANLQIRAEVVKNIAPYNASVLQIVNRLRDTEIIVRMMALRRCADLGPKFFKIFERQHILTCGITESNPKVKTVFVENLLPKWLNAYENNYISFLNALKLDADENDMTNTEKIARDVLNLLLRSTPINDVSSILSLDENKTIPLDKLTSEAVAVWNIVVLYLRDNENMEDYVDDIIPDLTPFCNYIESLVTEKGKNKMEDWEFLDYQYILNNLLGIAGSYDLSDEVGRKKLHQLTVKLLREENLLLKLKEKTVALAAMTAQKTDDFTSIVCHIISEIQEPLIEKQLEINPVEETNQEYQKAELKVKMIRLEAYLEDASDNQEFTKADALKNEIMELKKKLDELSAVKPTTEMVKMTKDDPKTMCECLDILIAMLSLPSVNTMTPSLVAVKDEFVVPLLQSNVSDINWRVLKCIALFCILDESMAEEYLKVICIPIITYKAIPNYNKQALMVSVRGIVDMFRLYGADVFSCMETEIVTTSSQSLNTTSNKRRLYRAEESDETVVFTNKFHLESIIEVILDMLDDEISEIRNIAIEAISKLILNGFPVSAPLITRLTLKWYNPLTAQGSDKSQQLIGVVISNYAKTTEGAKEVIAKAVIPTLQSIVRAPRTSPLADVDVDNLLLFFSTITNSEEKMDVSSTHINMALIFTYEILGKKNDLTAVYLSKLLLYLDVSTDNVAVIKELIAQVKAALDDESIADKTVNRNLIKFTEKLNAVVERHNKTIDTNLEITENSNMITIDENNKENEDMSVISGGQRRDSSKVTNLTERTTTSNLSLIREEEEDLFESSTRERRPKAAIDEQILESDSTDDEEAIRCSKRIKVILDVMTSVEKASKAYYNETLDNSKKMQVTSQRSDKNDENKDSDKNTSNSEDIISASPEIEEVDISKSNKRKRSVRQKMTKNTSPDNADTDTDTRNTKKRKNHIENGKKNGVRTNNGFRTTRNKKDETRSETERKNKDSEASEKKKKSNVQNNLKKHTTRSKQTVTDVENSTIDETNSDSDSESSKEFSENRQENVNKKNFYLRNSAKKQPPKYKGKLLQKSNVTNDETSSDVDSNGRNISRRIDVFNEQNQSLKKTREEENNAKKQTPTGTGKVLRKNISTTDETSSEVDSNTRSTRRSGNDLQSENISTKKQTPKGKEMLIQKSNSTNDETSSDVDSNTRSTRRSGNDLQSENINTKKQTPKGKEMLIQKSNSTTDETSSEVDGNTRSTRRSGNNLRSENISTKKPTPKGKEKLIQKSNSTNDETSSDVDSNGRNNRMKISLFKKQVEALKKKREQENVKKQTTKDKEKTLRKIISSSEETSSEGGGFKTRNNRVQRSRKHKNTETDSQTVTPKRLKMHEEVKKNVDTEKKVKKITERSEIDDREITPKRKRPPRNLKSMSAKSKSLNVYTDSNTSTNTTLHTILSEISQVSIIHDVSSFSSPTSLNSRVSTRSRSSSQNSPIIKKQAPKSLNLEKNKRPTRGQKT